MQAKRLVQLLGKQVVVMRPFARFQIVVIPRNRVEGEIYAGEDLLDLINTDKLPELRAFLLKQK